MKIALVLDLYGFTGALKPLTDGIFQDFSGQEIEMAVTVIQPDDQPEVNTEAVMGQCVEALGDKKAMVIGYATPAPKAMILNMPTYYFVNEAHADFICYLNYTDYAENREFVQEALKVLQAEGNSHIAEKRRGLTRIVRTKMGEDNILSGFNEHSQVGYFNTKTQQPVGAELNNV